MDNDYLAFSKCQSGIEFEEIITLFLQRSGFEAKRVGKNDNGIDIIATQVFGNETFRFYIQCKFYNKTLGKAPIQEIFAGTAFHREYGLPVVITNNMLSVDARLYARDLGVEIISTPEWKELKEVMLTHKIENPNQHTGLLGIMLAYAAKDNAYLQKALPHEKEKEKAQSKKELKLQVISEMDEAEECIKEATHLQQQAARYQQKALNIQKRILLRGIDYD